MSEIITVFGVTRQIPETDEVDWGAEMTRFSVDIGEAADANQFKDDTRNVARDSASASSTLLAAAATFTPTRTVHKIEGSGGAVILSLVTAIADGVVDGQRLILIGNHAVNTVRITDGANVTINGNVTLALGESIELRWDAGLSSWLERHRNP